MANGNFKNYVYYSGNGTGFGLYCEYTYSQNISGNYTDVTVDAYINYYSLDVYPRSGTVTINGTSKSFTSPEISNYPSSGSGRSKLTSQTVRVSHNSDGTKTGVSLSVTWSAQLTYSGTWYSSLSASTTVSLPTIPRASSITSAGNVTLGNACSVKWTPASTSFKYKLKFSLSTWNYTTGFISPSTTSAYTYTGYTIPANSTLYALIPNSTTGTMSVTLTTYNSSGTKIGSTSAAKTFTVTVPSSIVPTVGTINLNPADINNQNILVQGKNKLTVSVSGWSAGSGSSIRSYAFSGPGISYTGTNTSTTSSGVITDKGTLTYTVTVTDTRGRTASRSLGLTCFPWSAPSITLNAYRAASSTSTTENDSGTYVRCTYNLSYSSVNNTNKVTVKIFYKKNTESNYSSVEVLTNSTDTSGTYILSGIDVSSTYSIYAVVSDSYSGSSQSSVSTIFSAARIMNIRADGNGIAFGKMAESDDLFDVKWPIKSEGSYVAKEPISLYSSTVGNIGTITLSYNASDFTYLEIFYTDNNSRQPQSVKIYSPDGKYVSLACIEPSTSGSVPKLYIRSSGWTISGTSMTVGRSDLSGMNRGVYGQLYAGANGTTSDVYVTENNYIKIFKILGYK